MNALLTALLSYAGSEVVSRIAQALFGGKGKVADTIKEIAPNAVENLPTAVANFRARIKDSWKKRFGADITAEQMDAIDEATK